MADFKEEHMNPFHVIKKEERNSICNLIAKKELIPQESEYRIDIMQLGQETYKTFVQENCRQNQIIDGPIKELRTKSKKPVSSINVQQQCSSAQRFIEIARERAYSIQKLLSYELTQTSVFLSTDGFLKKSVKSDLMHELEKLLDDPSLLELPPSEIGTTVAVDFMAQARKVTKISASVNTFGNLASVFLGKRCFWLQG